MLNIPTYPEVGLVSDIKDKLIHPSFGIKSKL